MTLEEQALKLYPPLSCYEKEPIEYNRRQAACREAWLRAKREDAAENEKLTREIAQLRSQAGDSIECQEAEQRGFLRGISQQQAVNSEEGK